MPRTGAFWSLIFRVAASRQPRNDRTQKDQPSQRSRGSRAARNVAPQLEGHELDVLQAEVRSLRSRLENALEALNQYEKLASTLSDAYQSVSTRYVSGLREVQDKANCLGDLTSLLHTHQQKNLKLLSDLEATKAKISALTGDILRLEDNRLEAKHDDYFFATEFAGVFRAVEEWVYVTYINWNIEELQQLEEEVVNLFQGTAGKDWQRWLKADHTLLLTGVIMELLVRKMLELPLLGMKDSCVALVTPAIEKSLLENTEEDIKWRTKTIQALTHSSLFWGTFDLAATELANELFTKFSRFTQRKPAVGIKKLAKVIKDGASVAIKCQQEPSKFQFIRFPPGTACQRGVAGMVSDAMSKISDKALAGEENGKWAVAMTVTPAVVRVPYNSERDVVVVKARVVLKELSQEELEQRGVNEEEKSSDGDSTSDWESGNEEDSSGGEETGEEDESGNEEDSSEGGGASEGQRR